MLAVASGGLSQALAEEICVSCQRSYDERLDWSLSVDNDVLTGTGNDYGYTGGFAFTLVGEPTKRFAAPNYRALERMDEWLGVDRFHRVEETAFAEDALQVGAVMFTPEDLLNGGTSPDDRPYANLLYMSHTHYALNLERNVMHQSTFTLGLLGSSVAQELQGAIHSVSGMFEPRNYEHQISDGGELTFRYAAARHALLADGGKEERARGFDLKLTLEGSVGYLTEGAAALSLRWGRLGTPWWSAMSEHAEYSAQPAPRARAQGGRSEFYFLAGTKLRARAYNVFLQGQFRDSTLTFSSSDLNRLVLDAWVGVAREVAGFHITYVVRHQTREIRNGPAAKSLTWAGFTVTRYLH